MEDEHESYNGGVGREEHREGVKKEVKRREEREM